MKSDRQGGRRFSTNRATVDSVHRFLLGNIDDAKRIVVPSASCHQSTIGGNRTTNSLLKTREASASGQQHIAEWRRTPNQRLSRGSSITAFLTNRSAIASTTFLLSSNPRKTLLLERCNCQLQPSPSANCNMVLQSGHVIDDQASSPYRTVLSIVCALSIT